MNLQWFSNYGARTSGGTLAPSSGKWGIRFFLNVLAGHTDVVTMLALQKNSLYVDYNLNDIHFPILLQKIVLRTLEIYLMHTTAQYLFFKNTDSLKP